MNDTSLPSAEHDMIYVPIDSIAIDGVAPEIGDEVDLAITARVDSVEGDQACVVPVRVNGQDVESAPEATGEEESLEDMGNRLRSQVDSGY